MTWVIASVDAVAVIFITQLLVFHLYLIVTGQTTYEYITDKINREQEFDEEELNKEEKIEFEIREPSPRVPEKPKKTWIQKVQRM